MKLPLLVIVALMVTDLAIGQKRTIIGRVVDEETQKPVSNAEIRINNTTIGTYSNALGFFELTVADTNKIFVASHVGYITAMINVPGEDRFKFVLKKQFTRLQTLFVDNYPVDTTKIPFFLCRDPKPRHPNDAVVIEYAACPHAGIQRFYAMIGNTIAKVVKPSDAPFLGVTFTVNKEGRVTDILMSDSTSVVAESVRSALEQMPSWMPAHQKGVATSQSFTFLITYKGGPNDEVLINLQKFLSRNISYTFEAYRDDREGVVNVEFSVDNNGKVSDIVALSDVGHQSVLEVKHALEDVPVEDMRSLVKNTAKNRFLLPVVFAKELPYNKNTKTTGSKAYRLPEVMVSHNAFISFEPVRKRATGGQVKRLDHAESINLAKRTKTLYLPEQKLQSLPLDILQLEDLRVLALPTNELVELPDRFGTLTNLRMLDLTRNRIKSLPHTFDDLQRLQRLSLNYNDLHAFPVEILHLEQLELLEMSNNSIKDIPDGISSFSRLVVLAMGDNQVDKLPNVLFALKNLKELYLNTNKIQDLPSTFVDLQNLERLDLSNNKFEIFPKEILLMRNLRALDLSDNNFSAIPDALGDIKSLRVVVLRGNPIPKKLIEDLRSKRPDLRVIF